MFKMHAAMAVAWRICVWVLLIGSLACFTFISFARPTEWYRTSQGVKDAGTAMNIPFPGDVPIATTVVLRNGKNTTVNVGRDVALMSGGTLFPIVLQWGSVLVAALCTTALLPGWRSTPAKASRPISAGTVKGLVSAVMIQVRRIATYPLPPRHFWAWFCGGLNAIELLVFATWLGFSVVYVYYNIDKGIRNVGARLAPPPPQLGRSTAPSTATTGSTGVPANLAIPAMFAVRRLDACGKATGEALRGMIMVMFIPVSRSSFLKWLFGADFSYLIKFHRWMSWGTILVATLHGLLYIIEWGAAGDLFYEFQWDAIHHENVTGLVSLIAGIAIAATSSAWMRANYYKVFINTHIIGFMLFILFGLMHYKSLVNWIMPGLLMYGLDRAFRFWQLSSNWALVQPSDLSADGSVATLRLRWHAGSRVLPGQTVYLRIPRLSWLQSHPFSVAGVEEVAPADPNSPPACAMTVHMKVAGDWTRGLCGLAWSGRSVWVQVEGPYDTCLDPAPAGPVVVMIAGGIGITPLLGLLRHYLAHPASRPRTTYLMWTCRALCELRLLGEDLVRVAAPLNSNDKASVPSKDMLHTPHTSPHLSSGSWLHAALHYTGFEGSAAGDWCAATGKAAMAPARIDSASASTDSGSHSADARLDIIDNLASPQAIQTPATSAPGPLATRLLTPHPLAQPALYGACLVLSVFGAFAGLTTSNYIDAYQARVTAAGVFYPVVGVMQWFLIAIGMIVPPASFLAFLSCLHRFGLLGPFSAWLVGSGAASGALLRDSDAESGDLAQGKAVEMAVGPARGVESVGGVEKLLAISTGAKGLMRGLELHRGRPDVAALLRRVLVAHAGECGEVEVLVGGPPAMWEAALEACVRVHGEVEVAGAPVLRPRRVAHQH